jgi:hypothetical protein
MQTSPQSVLLNEKDRGEPSVYHRRVINSSHASLTVERALGTWHALLTWIDSNGHPQGSCG